MNEFVDPAIQQPVDEHDGVANELLPLVYDELRKLASGFMRRERQGHTLRPTDLVNEVCLRFLKPKDHQWQSRAHFFSVASLAMRQVLVNHARTRGAVKRQAFGGRVALNEADCADTGRSTVDLLILNEMLERLAVLDPTHVRLVEMRVFGGMSTAEMAHVLGQSHRTVERHWRAVRAWLAAEMRRGDDL